MAFLGHKARKRFGQHWLKDASILERIVEAADLQSHDHVLEVGPGRGALTARLLSSQVAGVQAIELDRDLVVGLRERFGQDSRFSLKEGDVLQMPLTSPDCVPANKVVANIPYNITGPLLERLLGSLGRPIEKTYQLLVLLLQKEVADRILARAGESNFSAMSVRIQLLARCRNVCLVPPSCFQPQPKVQSQVIAFEPLKIEERIEPALANRVEGLLRVAFVARRKMLRNSLSVLSCFCQLEALAEEVGINLNQRPQELSPETWLALARRLNQADEVGENP